MIIISRSADYTIQGFIYQFHKTLLEILNSETEDVITVEGIIEDIDVINDYGTTAIQCKYHETKKSFQLSTVYKPILQMMKHFYITNKSNKISNISYRLFAYFPNEKPGEFYKLTVEDVKEIIASKNSKYATMINELNAIVEFDKEEGNQNSIYHFLEVFEFQFGHSLEYLTNEVLKSLKESGLDEDNVEILHYPNAIQRISNLSMEHFKADREITKQELTDHLKKIKKTAISKWTLSLKTLKQILNAKKLELRGNLNKNSRLRYFIISEALLIDFKEEIVNFISDYVAKYHFKPLHDKTPIFCFDCKLELYNDLVIRLYKKNIRSNTGMIINNYFDQSEFLKEPIRKNEKEYFREFDIRLTRLHDGIFDTFNFNKPDDYFLFIDKKPQLDYLDTNVEHLIIEDFKQVKFILGMSGVYE